LEPGCDAGFEAQLQSWKRTFLIVCAPLRVENNGKLAAQGFEYGKE
jgi:hypothetical protein